MNYAVYAILGIFTVFIFSASILASAETGAKSTAFEKTTLLEFTNNDSSPVHTIKLWLGKDVGTFKSFKAEKGWTGVKNSQGVLVFTSTEPLGSGESVKFGIKTEIESPGVNWKTSDSAGNELSVGKVTPQHRGKIGLPDYLKSATFKIIPESPKTGDSIRIVGEGFPKNTVLNLMINNEKLEDIRTDESGRVIGTAKIPITIQSDRIDLSLEDSQGSKKTISIRVKTMEETPAPQNTKKLTVDNYITMAEPGQKISTSGTGKPGSSVTITGKDPAGSKLYQAVVTVDALGNWQHETTIPLDAPLGTRTVEFSDGIETITKSISISITKIIKVDSPKTKYDPGEKFIFNGTAKPGQTMQVVINDPIGKEIHSDLLEIGESGVFNFEYQTTATSIKGTYVVFLTHGAETEIIRVGLGELPGPQIIAKFDKLNYASSDTAKLTIKGPAKSTISILIIDPTDKVKLTERISLGLDGSKVFDLVLSQYKSGVYNAVIKHSQSETSVVFSVGLQTTTGNISIQATKPEYLPGDNILVLGSTNPNIILNLQMTDPDGKIIKNKDIFSDNEGKFSEGTFRVPSDAKQGSWVIKAKSGAKFAEVKFNVSGTAAKTFNVKIDKTTPYTGGDYMTITGSGGGKSQNGVIIISDSKNNNTVELRMSTTKEGSFQTFWSVPQGIEPGKYTIKVTVGAETTETTFDLQ